MDSQISHVKEGPSTDGRSRCFQHNTPNDFIEYFLQLPPYALAVHRDEAKDTALSLLDQYASYQSALKASLDKHSDAPGVNNYLSLLVQSPKEPEASVPPVSVLF